ncbi:MAG: sugar nucleotide-binding protein [Microthrixaceae bacterium]
MLEGTVLLTGASGLLGTWLRRTAPTESSIVCVQHRTPLKGVVEVSADLCDREAVRAVIASVRPTVVIHAAYSKSHQAIVTATRHLAEASHEFGAHHVYISSDAVFSGENKPQRENDVPDPIWDYGHWKAEAERITASKGSGTIIRLPLIVSVDPADHVVHSITAAAALGRQTKWFVDEFRQPASASELAEACWRIASLDAHQNHGVWHLPGPESLSRFDIADRVVSAMGLDPSTIERTKTPRGAKRPRSLHLTDDRARTSIAWDPSAVLPERQIEVEAWNAANAHFAP